jgi:DNA-binding NtrC family response regulator
VTIQVPPLRERRDEIPELADHFLAEANARLHRSITRLAPDTLAALMDYSWPGNVRELRNMIERAVVVNDGDVLALGSFPAPIRPPEAPGGAAGRRRTGRRGAPARRHRAIGVAPGEEAPHRGRPAEVAGDPDGGIGDGPLVS